MKQAVNNEEKYSWNSQYINADKLTSDFFVQHAKLYVRLAGNPLKVTCDGMFW